MLIKPIIALAISASSILVGYTEPMHVGENQDIPYADGYVFEDFVITQIDNNGDIHGEKTVGKGEGIFLEESIYNKFQYLEKFKVGDKITVAWSHEDYTEENWDNILEIEKVGGIVND